MINTSIDYRRAVEKNRQFILQDKIIFDNKKSLTLSMEDVTAYSINEASSGNGKFEIGAAIVKEYKASLNNMDGKLDGIEFEGADISAKIGLLLQGGSYEYLRKGEFRIVEAKERDLTIDIKAYDGMLYFDKPYSESTLRYPATVNQILSDACISCQMTLNARSVQMGSLVVRERPDDEAVTFRDIISFCAQIMGCYAVINNLGQLEFRWYDFATLDSLRDDWYDGGVFDKGMPYATGDTADGGRFNPWDTGAVIDGGSFAGQGEYHHAYLLKSQSINTNDVTITGISVTVKQGTDGQEKTYLYGQEGYVLELSGNLLVQEENVQAVLQHVGQKITGNTFRPLSVSAQSDPSIEAGDLVIVTDRKQKSYLTVVTNTTFSLSGSQKIECSAETPTEKNYTRYGAVTKLISSSKDKMNQMVNQQLSAYDIASRQLSSLMARSMGLYETYDVQDDGSTIKYQHDKPNLSDSKTIWKQTQGAFAVSTDGGKTWNAGTDAEGNALFNVLSVIGFYFDWAKGGTLTLGGGRNQYGVLILKDERDWDVGTFDKNGVSIRSIAETQTTVNNQAGYHFSKTIFAPKGLEFRGGYMNRNEDFLDVYIGGLEQSFSYNYDLSAGWSQVQITKKEVTLVSRGSNGIASIGVKNEDGKYSSKLEMREDYAYLNTELIVESIYGAHSKGYVDGIRLGVAGILIGEINNFSEGTDASWEKLVAGIYIHSNAVPHINPIPNSYNVCVKGSFASTGSKSRIVQTENFAERSLYCYEMPSPMFGDIGEGITDENGECYVYLDDIFAESVFTKIEYQVFLQKEGQGNIWVEEKTLIYFLVKGTKNLKFAWELKAKQKGYEFERLERFEKPNANKEIDYEEEYLEEIEILIHEQEDTLYETA